MTPRGVKIAQAKALERAQAARGGSWDKRRAPSWRRSGPKAVIVRRPRMALGALILTPLAIAGGACLGFHLSQALGLF